MKKFAATLFAAFLIIAAHTWAQEFAPRQAVNIEIGGKGLLYSINYEYQFAENFMASAGISFLHISESEIDKSSNFWSFPISASYIYEFSGGHCVEAGIGIMNLVVSGDLVEYAGSTDYFLNPTIIAAYRYQPVESKWRFRIAATPFVGTKSPTHSEGTAFQPLGAVFQIWGGLSIGYEL